MTLDERRQKRLDEWRKNIKDPLKPKIIPSKVIGRGAKNDYGDVQTQEEWDEEIRLSQRRK